MAACLRALEMQTVETEVVVADNGPGEGSAELLASFPNVERISFGGRNLGFGVALNRAIADRGTGPVILLNDDTVPEPDFVENLLAVWNGGETAMVAAVLLRADDPGLIDSAGIMCDRTMTGWIHLAGQPVLTAAAASDPLGPMGAAGLYDRAAFESVGGFDERLFLYYEDLDLALRMRIAGYGCRLAPGARALHVGSATTGRRSTVQNHHTNFGRGYMLRKYGVARRPGLLAKSALSESTAGLAQLLIDRTTVGIRGKAQGWKAARDVTRLVAPDELLEPASLRRHTQVRLQRRRP